MEGTTITFRTDAQLKKDAAKLYESLGMSLSTALNLFMRQSVMKQKFPCSLEYEISKDCTGTYPEGFFELFGADDDAAMRVAEELSYGQDSRREEL